jgi:hypothetical protein
LIQQVLGEILRAGCRVVHGVELFVALAVVRCSLAVTRARVGVKFLVFEELADLGQPIKVVSAVGILFDNQGLFRFGEFLTGLDALLLVVARDLGFGLAKLENRIAREFLLNAFLQRHQGQLKDLHALNHPRGEQLPLLHTHRG